MTAQPRTAILFVCLGNICRSPLAEGLFRGVLAERGLEGEFHVESAALGDWHTGSPPDSRSIAVARECGIEISGQRARKIEMRDFSRFDLIFGMDRANVRALRQKAPEAASERIHLFLRYTLGREEDIPDPYYGGGEHFATVRQTIREACDALATRLSARDDSELSSGQASSIT